jgi:Zn-dependent peptidase ImmA (M78 family)/DNA-binding XRE family transcriptional regulator
MDISKVNPKMITLGREYRGYNQAELSEGIGVTQGFLSKIEKGILAVNEDVLYKLSSFLKLDKGFFIRQGDTFPPNLYYRKKSKTAQKVLTKAEAEMNIHRLNIQELLKSIDISSESIPVMDVEEHGSPKEIAIKLRAAWGIPSGPIVNLFQEIERRGTIIVICDFGSLDIDGRSMFTDNKQPIIFINKNIPSDRQRFTVCHELGHLIMHINVSVPDERDIEKESNIFASEFLIPENDLRKQIFKAVTLSDLADLKRFWRVSMQAIMYKASASKIITANNYKSLMQQISKYGMRIKEPLELEPPKEKAQILLYMINLHLNELDFTESELSKVLGFTTRELKEKYLNNDEPPKLKVVI